jgi:hypothetical protein
MTRSPAAGVVIHVAVLRFWIFEGRDDSIAGGYRGEVRGSSGPMVWPVA